jgi:hypothetical protein
MIILKVFVQKISKIWIKMCVLTFPSKNMELKILNKKLESKVKKKNSLKLIKEFQQRENKLK